MSSAAPRILITGTTGQIGGEILKLLSHSATIFAPSRIDLDLADESSIRRYVQRTRPEWIINPGAYTGVDKAESESHLAHAINAEAPRILGEEAARLGGAVIHFSTDYVFDGMADTPYVETDATAPLNVYGRTKLAGEQALAASGARHFILRTSWVYGATGRNFLLTVLRVAAERASRGEPMKIVADQHGAPTWSHDLARLTAQIVETGPSLQPASGIFHAAAAGETTWHGFASTAIAKLRELRPATPFADLVPIATADYPTAARRPMSSRLNCEKLARTLQFEFRHWSAALDDVLAHHADHSLELSKLTDNR